jgi:hypothetical protein
MWQLIKNLSVEMLIFSILYSFQMVSDVAVTNIQANFCVDGKKCDPECSKNQPILSPTLLHYWRLGNNWIMYKSS